MNKKCFNCGKLFPIIVLNNQTFYQKINKIGFPVHKIINVEQIPAEKYFCKKDCKKKYLENKYKKKWG